MHYVTVYITPGDSNESKNYLRYLKWILYRIHCIDSKPNIVVVGDFNKIAMQSIGFLDSSYKLDRVIEEGVPTHQLGGCLDGVWTNMKYSSVSLTEGMREVTDHSMIQFSLLIDGDVKRTLTHKEEELTTQREIRAY